MTALATAEPTPEITDATPMTVDDQTRLAELEDGITAALTMGFAFMGRALEEIRSGRYYRGTHSAFEVYCREKWGFTSARAGQLIASARVAGLLDGIVEGVQPNESHCRALLGVEGDDERVAVWKTAVDEAPGTADGKRKVTSAQIRTLISASTATKGGGSKAPPEVHDATGAVVPGKLRSVFDGGCALFDELTACISEAKSLAKKISAQKAGTELAGTNIELQLRDAFEAAKFSRPHAVCACEGKGCDTCKDRGWLPKGVHDALVGEPEG